MQQPRLATIAAGLLATAFVASPAQANPPADDVVFAYAPATSVTIEVTNNNALDVQVFIVAEDGGSERLGTVRRQTTKSLVVPAAVLDEAGKIRIKVVTLESTTPHTLVQRALDGVKTAPFEVWDGQTIRLLVREELTLEVDGEG